MAGHPDGQQPFGAQGTDGSGGADDPRGADASRRTHPRAPEPPHSLPRVWSHPLFLSSVGVVLVSALWMIAQWAEPLVHPLVSWVPALVNALLSAAACLWTARTMQVAALRRFWRTFGIAMVVISCAVCGNAIDHADQIGRGGSPHATSSVTTALFYLAVVLVAWALIRLPVHRRSSRHSITIGLDITIVLAGAVLVGWYYAMRGSVALSEVTGSPWTAAGVIALGGLGMLAVIKVAIAGTGALDRRALWTLGGTILCSTALSSLTPLVADKAHLHNSQIATPLSTAGVVLALLYSRRGVLRSKPAPPRSERPFSFLPYLAIAGTDAFVFAVVGQDHVSTRVLVGGSMLLTALVVARQLIAFYENVNLLAKVDAGMLELRRHERRFRSLIQNSSDVIAITDNQGVVTYISPGVMRMLGVPAEFVVGQHVLNDVHRDDLDAVRAQFAGLAGPGETSTCQMRIRHRDGSWRLLEVLSTNLLHDPSVRGVVSNARDITDTRRIQDELAYQANHDALTGLPNRSLFNERIARAFASGGDLSRLGLLLVDLDDFKSINDRLGHAVGDALLVAVSHRLRECTRPADLMARLGGDEFALLLTDVDAADATLLAESIVDAFAEPVRAAGYELLVQASVGLARYTPDCKAHDLLRRADVAMYAAKELGKSRWVEYGPDLDANAVEHARLAAELLQALDRDELRVVYQPIVELPTGALRGVEALVRWQHPERGMISPTEFIPMAERTGLIVPLGAWVLREACRQGALWHRLYGDAAPMKISVNASARQLLDPAFVETVAFALRHSRLSAERLTIEITETAVFGGGPAVDTVRALHEMGIKIALDDFGTGHSSLGLLRTCPVDVLKVDKSFVDGVTGTVEQEAIATSISEIAQALRLEAIAEGVETGAQATRLYEMGYQLAQGFYFARPMSGAEIDKLCVTAAVPVEVAPVP